MPFIPIALNSSFSLILAIANNVLLARFFLIYLTCVSYRLEGRLNVIMYFNIIHCYISRYQLVNRIFILFFDLLSKEHVGHAHITYAVIEKSQEGSYAIKPLKQKQVVDGLSYLLQEIYGIENKSMERMKVGS